MSSEVGSPQQVSTVIVAIDCTHYDRHQKGSTILHVLATLNFAKNGQSENEKEGEMTSENWHPYLHTHHP